ncbi:hypothetical protein [Treponema sp. R6D11]
MDDLKDRDSEFYLNLILRKSDISTDADGNYIFEVEASNENLDLQKQVVLQRALLDSKDDFLNTGVISYDHQHKRRGPDGEVISDPTMIIGEPIEVRTEGKKTIVKGKLYHTSDKAQEIINLLKAKSTRIKASVGGIFPKIVKNAKDGIERITSVFWNDLALTPSPVNHTVSPAYFAKSYNPDEFVKALMATSDTTDHAQFTGGRAMTPEDVGGKKPIDVTKIGIKKLVRLMDEGKIDTEEDAVGFLVEQGIDEANARTAVREIIFQGGQTTMKGKFASAVSNILKSLTGKDDGKGNNNEDDTEKDDDLDLDIAGLDTTDEDDEGKDVGKSTKVINANELLVNLQEDLDGIKKSLDSVEDIRQSIEDLGDAVTEISKALAIVANAPAPTQSILGKSAGQTQGIQKGGRSAVKDRPTLQDFEKAQIVINKAYKAGRIGLHEATRIEGDMQKAVRDPNFNLRAEDYDFLMQEMKATA